MNSMIKPRSDEAFFKAARTFPARSGNGKGFPIGPRTKRRQAENREINPEFGWVIDYADISKVMQPILVAIDHTNIDVLFAGKREKCSDAPQLKPSTAENLAIWFYNQLKPTLPSVIAIEIKETASSLVVYRP